MTTTAAAIASSSFSCYCSSSFCPSYSSSYKLNVLTTTNRSRLSIPESKRSSSSIHYPLSSLSSSIGGGGGGPRQIGQSQQQQEEGRLKLLVSCQVALNNSIQVSSKEEDEDEEMKKAQDKIGSRVRVKVPVKVYHVPKIPELDLTGMEGELKQYVGLWKGKRISANFPFKIQFSTPVKFFAHLKEDEFDYIINQDPPPTTTTM